MVLYKLYLGHMDSNRIKKDKTELNEPKTKLNESELNEIIYMSLYPVVCKWMCIFDILKWSLHNIKYRHPHYQLTDTPFHINYILLVTSRSHQ